MTDLKTLREHIAIRGYVYGPLAIELLDRCEAAEDQLATARADCLTIIRVRCQQERAVAVEEAACVVAQHCSCAMCCQCRVTAEKIRALAELPTGLVMLPWEVVARAKAAAAVVRAARHWFTTVNRRAVELMPDVDGPLHAAVERLEKRRKK